MLGTEVVQLLGRAQEDVLIVAPFMKAKTLSRLLDVVPDVVKVTLVTRWRPTDVLSGVTDLETMDLANQRSSPLYLHHNLHAKLFAADDQCLVGSANVTDSGLGWRNPANLELLALFDRKSDEIVAFENTLFSEAVLATAEQRTRIEELALKLRELPAVQPQAGELEESVGLSADWVPRARNPDELYNLYCGDTDVSRSVREVMEEELNRLAVIPGLGLPEFRSWVGTVIAQTPLISWVMQRIESNGEVDELSLDDKLVEIGAKASGQSPREVLQTVQRWMNHFLPMHYETAQDTIKLIKAKEL